MERLPSLVIMLATALLCGGCVSGFTNVTGIKGRVVDARTHAPIVGAKVSIDTTVGLIMPRFTHENIPVSATGAFLIQPVRVELSPNMDAPQWQRDITINAPGYIPFVRSFYGGTGEFFRPPIINLGVMPLTCKKQ